jgi:hypothetical protein
MKAHGPAGAELAGSIGSGNGCPADVLLTHRVSPALSRRRSVNPVISGRNIRYISIIFPLFD